MALRGARKPVTDAAALYDRAVAALARRGRSRTEMERWLRARGAAAAPIREVLARLEEHGYLDDCRFAESFAAHERETQNLGAARVRRDLRRRGVAAALTETAVTEAFAGEREEDLIAAFLRRKRSSRPQTLSEAARLFRRLWQAGFSSPAIHAALRRWRVNPEWLEELAAAEWEASEPDSVS